jgi:alanyl-tRNA synthetase
MDSFLIRQKFLNYFEKNGHTVVSSSSLIPAEDPTLLFTNAGMNQFKDVFLGKEKRSYTRATSIQKCVRAGGKHNDLDQVGFTARHLTFFEMMGNFSFGDYFKPEAISYAWEFLTKEVNLPAEKLYASVFKDDTEAYDFWLNMIKLPPERIIKLGEADNFWAMGDTGPCGPCTEIYLDRGEQYGCEESACLPGCSCDRFIEIWNNVFMQYNRQADGELKPLTQTGVDTGMGLERLCMVIQGTENLFNIDSMKYLIECVEQIAQSSYDASDEKTKAAYHVLADHIRSSSLLIADGCSPANDGRGYVLRKIIRRAALFAQKITADHGLFSKLAETFIEHMSPIYPELKQNRKLILSVLESEIERFSQNLVNGQHILQKYFEKNKQDDANIITGLQAFTLYDTYGFPLELTILIGMDHGFAVDRLGFEQEMEKQRLMSGKKMKTTQGHDISVANMATIFVGYETTENTSTIQFVTKDDDHFWLSTESSPFYVESGGQVNDRGSVTINGQTFEVVDLKKAGETFKPAIMVKIKTITIDGQPAKEISVGDQADSRVDVDLRAQTVKNHTATHMLQAALLQILGPQVKQAGSVVHEKYLRFDFSQHHAMTKDEIRRVEEIINNKIQEDIQTIIHNMTLKEAKEKGIISFFGEKYNPEHVRVVEIPGFSAELCGGTHASRTGIIGAFKIISESALSTGTRRIFAITGPEAIRTFQESFDTTKQLAEMFKIKPEGVIEAVEKTQSQLQEAHSTIKQLKKQLFKAQIPSLIKEIDTTKSVPFLFLELDSDVTTDDMKQICGELGTQKPGFYFMKSTPNKDDGRFVYLGYLCKEYASQLDLKAFAQFIKDTFNLKGGGSALFIQGGGTNTIDNLKHEIKKWLS